MPSFWILLWGPGPGPSRSTQVLAAVSLEKKRSRRVGGVMLMASVTVYVSERFHFQRLVSALSAPYSGLQALSLRKAFGPTRYRIFLALRFLRLRGTGTWALAVFLHLSSTWPKIDESNK